MKTTMNLVDYKLNNFLEACKEDHYLSKYPKIGQTIDHYITRIKQVEQEVLANPIALPKQLDSRKITLDKGGYAHLFWLLEEDGHAVIHWDVNKLREMKSLAEKRKVTALHFAKSFHDSFELQLDDALEKEEEMIWLHDDYTNEYFVVIGEQRVFDCVKALMKNNNVKTMLEPGFSFAGIEMEVGDEKFPIEGWEFPVKTHLDAMVSDLDRTLYKVICNIRLLYTYYSEDLENELHYALERFEARCLYEV